MAGTSKSRRSRLGPASGSVVTKVLSGAVQGATTAADASPRAGGEPDVIDVLGIPATSPSSKVEDPLSQPVVGWTDGRDSYIMPVCNPDLMWDIYLRSAFLPPLVDAFVSNVYGTGHTLRRIIDLREEEDRDKIRKAAQYILFANTGTARKLQKEELNRIEEELTLAVEVEEERLAAFFRQCSLERSFAEMMILSGQDLEVTGNAYWEILRDTFGFISRMRYVQSRTMRATLCDPRLVASRQLKRLTSLHWGETEQLRTFRKYIQLHKEGPVARFRELGDPRYMSRRTGIVYPTFEALQQAEQSTAQLLADGRRIVASATEIFHLRLPFAGSTVYGAPPWAGNYPGLLGSRELDEENLDIVSDSMIPNAMLLISGGRLNGADQKRLIEQIQNREPGQKELLIVQAQPVGGAVGGSATPTLKLERMKSEQTQDALFQNYDRRNEDKTDGAARMPRAILGKDVGQNRATTVAMRRFAEDQVFNPRRTLIDGPINDQLMPLIGARYHTLHVNAQQTRDPDAVTANLKALLSGAALTPNEARAIAEKVVDRPLPKIEQLWADIPPPVLVALLQTKNQVTAAALLNNDRDALAQLAHELATNLTAGAAGAVAPEVGGGQPKQLEGNQDSGGQVQGGGSGKQGAGSQGAAD